MSKINQKDKITIMCQRYREIRISYLSTPTFFFFFFFVEFLDLFLYPSACDTHFFDSWIDDTFQLWMECLTCESRGGALFFCCSFSHPLQHLHVNEIVAEPTQVLPHIYFWMAVSSSPFYFFLFSLLTVVLSLVAVIFAAPTWVRKRHGDQQSLLWIQSGVDCRCSGCCYLWCLVCHEEEKKNKKNMRMILLILLILHFLHTWLAFQRAALLILINQTELILSHQLFFSPNPLFLQI